MNMPNAVGFPTVLFHVLLWMLLLSHASDCLTVAIWA